MKSIVVSEPVWEAIANLGKFGETEDDVLRRVFKLPAADKNQSPQRLQPTTRVDSTNSRRSIATDRMSSYISGNELRISFESGPSSSWTLPAKSDKAAIRIVREKATSFAAKHGASLGQVAAVRKTLTDSGYHLIK